MSHAYGKCFFKDGLVLHFEYNGTIDVCCTRLRDSYREVTEHWRGNNTCARCTCGQSEPVYLYTDYGDGFHWEGRACRHCKAITDGSDLLDVDVTYKGEPSSNDIENL